MGKFDIVRTCSELGEWCDDPDGINGCLDCSHCDHSDRAAKKCPECPPGMSIFFLFLLPLRKAKCLLTFYFRFLIST